MYFSFKSWTDYILIKKFKISSILIGLKNSFFSTKALAKVLSKCFLSDSSIITF